ncbi:hypothetical protein BaRGS_00016510 [Batillaria attramentaria]|uniref:Uncharacterized protein n=1 Tax=Batillaria attramentaria TaxID=370345 RepID=A0ABD0KZ34_9CAEN
MYRGVAIGGHVQSGLSEGASRTDRGCAIGWDESLEPLAAIDSKTMCAEKAPKGEEGKVKKGPKRPDILGTG